MGNTEAVEAIVHRSMPTTAAVICYTWEGQVLMSAHHQASCSEQALPMLLIPLCKMSISGQKAARQVPVLLQLGD